MPLNNKCIVAIDSSGPTLQVGVLKGKQIYSARRSGIKQEQFFLPLLQRVLTKAESSLSDIEHIVFVRGPGRFTGIRISLTFASMMSSLTGAKISSATLFEVLRHQVQVSRSFAQWKQAHPQGILAVVLHAFREEYFLQFFDSQDTAPVWLSKQELLTKLAHYAAPLYVAGMDKDNQDLSHLLGAAYTLAPQADSTLHIKTLLALAAQPVYEKNALEPLYLKPARFELIS